MSLKMDTTYKAIPSRALVHFLFYPRHHYESVDDPMNQNEY